MPPTPSKLFHAIVGLGLAAAGCGGETQERLTDAQVRPVALDAAGAQVDAPVRKADVVDAGRPPVEAGEDATVVVDASDASLLDAFDAFDAATVHDAAQEAARDAWVMVPVK